MLQDVTELLLPLPPYSTPFLLLPTSHEARLATNRSDALAVQSNTVHDHARGWRLLAGMYGKILSLVVPVRQLELPAKRSKVREQAPSCKRGTQANSVVALSFDSDLE